MKALYVALRDRVVTTPGIKTVRMFNNQFERSNSDDPGQNTEQAFSYNCCFIEFPEDNEQISAGAGSKKLNVLVRFHIGFESYKLEDIAVFDQVEQVVLKVEGFSGELFTPLTYVAQRIDTDHNNVYIHQLDYRTTFTDNTKFIRRDAIIKEAPTALDLTLDLDIDNPIIRTGDGE